MGVTEDRMRMIASQPHKFSAAGNTLYVDIGEPKIGKLEVEFGPRQGGIGTPSPTNVRPIYGWSEINAQFHTGKNLFDKNNVEIGKNIGTDGSITDSAAARLTDYIPIGGQCVFWAEKYGTARLRLGLYDVNKGWLRRITSDYDGDLDVATVNDPQVAYVRACLFTSSDYIDTAMLELGTTRTTFEPYQGATATVDLGGTRYGGTVDLVSGTMTVTHYGFEMSNQTWVRDTDSYRRFNCLLPYPSKVQTAVRTIYSICSCEETYWHGESITTTSNHVAYIGRANTNANGFLYVHEPNVSSIADFKTLVAGQYVVYELETPQTVQLNPQTISLLRQQYTVKESANNHVAIDYWTYKRSQEPELPSGYTRLNYIQSQGLAYINPGLVLHSGFVVTVDLEVMTTTSNYAFWGYRWQGSYTDPYQCYFQCNGGNRRVFFGTNYQNAGNDAAYPFDERFTITINTTDGVVLVNGQKVTVNVNLSNIADSTGSTVRIPYLGAFNNNGTASTTNNAAKYYGYSVKENGALIQNFIPAINPNGVYGMFDTVSQSFFASAVTEQFIGG